MKHDVIVLGAGLAGLSCARDLMRGGADVLVVEARDRVGGRVEQATLPDGRLVQLGGEVVGRAHTAYLGLVDELGLSLVGSYVAEPGEIVYSTASEVSVGRPGWPFDSATDEKVTAAFVALAKTVDPDDPWSHPEAERLDRLPVSAWLREAGATEGVVRKWEIGQLALADGSYDRTSLLSSLRKNAAVPSAGHYDYDDWEGLRVAEGSATVALLMAASLGHRVRTGAPVTAVRIAPSGCAVTLASGEVLAAGAVVSALPVGPLRSVAVTGVSDARLESLHRQRNALAGKLAVGYARPFWRDLGRSGLSECEGVLGSTWPQSEGVLSALIPPERLAVLLGIPPAQRIPELLAEVTRMFGAAEPIAAYLRFWGTDPWTQGYVTQWAPGDVLAVGPLHGTHEPPFYVCGSDQWVAGYMEGAVRTGRAAAREALRRG
jgi:monoamine oxidase